MTTLTDGLSVLSTNWISLLVLLVGPLGFGVWLARPFTRGQNHSVLLTLALGSSLGWIAVALTVTLIILLGKNHALTQIGSLVLFGSSLALFGFWLLNCRPSRQRFQDVFAILAILALGLLCLILRLAFVKNLLLPPYSDSLFHVQLIDSFFSPHGFFDFLQTHGYYHFGVHAVTAWISALSGNDPVKIIALVGQYLIVIFPMGVFAFLKALKNRLADATLGALLAGFAWSFPAFTANWGKYPTLAAASLFPVFATLYLLVGRAQRKNPLILLFLVLGTGSLLLHSRLSILFVLVGFTWFVSKFSWKPPKPGTQHAIQGALLISTLLILSIKQDFRYAFVNDSFIVFLFLLITLPFLTSKPTQVVRGVCVFTLGLLLVTSWAIPFPLPGGATNLVDVPFALSILPFPLAVWLVTGIEAFSEWLPMFRLKEHFTIAVLSALVIFTFLLTDYQPDNCCNWVRLADIKAFNWIERNLPADSLIYIAGIDANGRVAAVDAGLWINPQTGLENIVSPLDTRWFDPVFHGEVCHLTPRFLYDSGLEQSFQIDTTSYPGWYRAIYASDGVTILEILPCTGSSDY